MKDLLKEIYRITFEHRDRGYYHSFDLPNFLIYAPRHDHKKIAVEIMKIFMRFNMDFSHYSYINASPSRYEKQFRDFCRSFRNHREVIPFLSFSKSLLEKGTPNPEEIACYSIIGATVYLLPLEHEFSFAGSVYSHELVKEIEECGREIYTLRFDGHNSSGWNLCLQATEMMKGAQSEKHSKKHTENNDLTISKSEAHQLVDRLFSLEEAKLKNEKLGVVEILEVPEYLEKKEIASIIDDHSKVHIIDAWLGLCCEVPYLVYCDSVSEALQLEKALKQKAVVCYSF